MTSKTTFRKQNSYAGFLVSSMPLVESPPRLGGFGDSDVTTSYDVFVTYDNATFIAHTGIVKGLSFY